MLYQLDKNSKDYRKVRRVTLREIGWKEADLERLVSRHIQDFIYSNDLMTIFTERRGQEEPDILALDKAGDLYIFELKRWSSGQENLLQVLRYGQLFGSSGYDELNELYQKYAAAGESLCNAHGNYFDLGEPSRLKPEDFNRRQHFVIMTNGLDQRTVEAIQYWKKNGLNIGAIVYWVFEIGGEHYIEFNMYSPIEGFLEPENSSYILNTNHSNNRQHNKDMLREHKAAAYYPGWREKIERLQKGDRVFLYKSGTGIVAYGIASGKLEKQDCDGHTDYEYYMRLESFRVLARPMSASRMKEAAGQGFCFQQTLFSVSGECSELLLEEIRKNHL